MSKEQKNLQQEVKELKTLYLLGPDIPLDNKIKEILENRDDCLIIGDGQRIINPDEIRQILHKKHSKIGANTRIDINGHGKRRKKDKTHKITLFTRDGLTKDVFKELKEIAGPNMPLYVHLWSCDGGSANKLVTVLGNSSILVTHIEAKESSAVQLSNYAISHSLKDYLDSQNDKLTPYQQFILDLPVNFEATTFNQVTVGGEVKKFKRTRIPKEKYMYDVLNQISKYQSLQDFINNFITQEIERFQKEFNLTNDQIGTYKDNVTNLNEEKTQIYSEGILAHIFCTENQLSSIEKFEEFLEKLQQKGVNINSISTGTNALVLASGNGKNDHVKLLLAHSANPNIQDQDGRTALYTAVIKGNLDIVKTLIEKEADINIQDQDGRTALHVVAIKGNLDIVRTLIEKEADINIQDNNGWTALHVAVIKGNLDIVKTLIKNGADVNIQENGGRTVRDIAIMLDNTDIIEILNAPITNQDNRASKILNEAQNIGKDLTRHLSKNSSNNTNIPYHNINDININRSIALNAAIERDDNERVKNLLLLADVDVNASDKNGNTPLITAVRKGNVELINILLEKEASPYKTDLQQMDVLDYVERSNNEVLKEIFNKYIVVKYHKQAERRKKSRTTHRER